MPCLFGKMFFGGGGASDSISGGKGSGIIQIFASDIANDGTVIAMAQGGSGGSLDDGGGAGGSVLFAVDTINGNGFFNINIQGGAGNSNGGGGGGGRAHFKVFESIIGAATGSVTKTGGTSGDDPGDPGTCRSENFSDLFSNGCDD
jgi:hypothetical protein